MNEVRTLAQEHCALVALYGQVQTRCSAQLREQARRIDHLEAEVMRHDEAYGLTALRLQAGEMLVPKLPRATGERLRVRIRARDVTLALRRPEQTSALNILPGIVTELLNDGGPQVEVKLDCGGDVLNTARPRWRP